MAVAALLLDRRSGGLAFVSGSIGVAALTTLAAALVFSRAGLIGWAIAILCVQYVERLIATSDSNVVIPAVAGVGVLAVGELSQWSLDSRSIAGVSGRLHLARGLAVIALLALGSATVLVCLMALAAPGPREAWTAGVAVVATVALLGVFSAVARAGLPAGKPEP